MLAAPGVALPSCPPSSAAPAGNLWALAVKSLSRQTDIVLNKTDLWSVSTGQSVKVIYAMAIVLTYPLQMWPVLEITWEKYVLGHWVQREDRWYELWETLYRSGLVLLTYLVAIVLPNLDFIISLLGVFCLSMLGITFPALMEVSWLQVDLSLFAMCMAAGAESFAVCSTDMHSLPDRLRTVEMDAGEGRIGCIYGGLCPGCGFVDEYCGPF
ncbi:Proton-coupled amino acid transporter-like protein [Frankliniella fusca]|uniref:Proton-coupled amino acid transporter-like protein n=1 Tax=Frankliniella fusca TaxID=407009 RepID=A0AAE1I3G8_9NEOP|nr:Proton-coupled amino acid transporter-like protein [Frankliniella fusca]